MSTTAASRKLLTPAQASETLNVSASTLRRWDKLGKIQSVRLPSGARRYAMGSNDPADQLAAINNALRSLPPAGGEFPVPQIQQYIGIFQGGRRWGLPQADEAIRADRTAARAMLRSLEIRAPLQSRMLAVAELAWSIEAEDKRDKAQAAVARDVQRTIENIPDFLKLKYWLLWAIWFGRAGVEVRYKWDTRGGRKVLVVDPEDPWIPVHGDTILFSNEDPTIGILVGSGGKSMPGTRSLVTEGAIPTSVHPLTSFERAAFILHTHERFPGDMFEPESAMGAHGLGIRSVLYWHWYVMSQVQAMMVEYIERVGTGLTIYEFEQGNSASYDAVKQLAESQSSNNVILWPRMPGQPPGAAGVHRIEPSSVALDSMLKVVSDYLGSLARKYIQGQDGTSESMPAGLNSNTSDTHESTFNRIVKFDAINLQETLSRDLVQVIQRWSHPGTIEDFKCRFVISVDKPNVKEYLDAAKVFHEMGGDLDEDTLRDIIGLPRPDADSVVIHGLTAGQPGRQMDVLPATGPGEGDGVQEGVVPAEGTPGVPGEAGDGEQAGAVAGSDLRSTVGGLQAIQALQTSFYEGKIPRAAVMANVSLLFGFTTAEAEQLFPDIPPTKLTEDQGELGQPASGQEVPAQEPAPFQEEDDDPEVTLMALLEVLSADLTDEQRDIAVDDIVGSDHPARYEGGFTGVKKDKAGRSNCWSGGRRIKCPEKAKPNRPARPTGQQVHDHIKAKLGSGNISKADVHELAGMLKGMTVQGIHELKRNLGLKASGSKATIVTQLSNRALAKAKEGKPTPATKPTQARPAEPAKAAPARTPEGAGSPPAQDVSKVAKAYLGHKGAASGHVSLADLHKETGLPIPRLHEVVQDMRRRGILSGQNAEAREGLSEEDRASMIRSGGDRIAAVGHRDESIDKLKELARTGKYKFEADFDEKKHPRGEGGQFGSGGGGGKKAEDKKEKDHPKEPGKKEPEKDHPKDAPDEAALAKPGGLKQAIKQSAAKAKEHVDRFKDKLDRVTDVKVLRQAKKGMGLLKDVTTRFNAKVMERYGRAGGIAVLASGQALGWGVFGVGLAIGVPLYLPGSSLWGSIPAAAVGEVVLALNKLRSEMEEELSEAEAIRLWKELQKELEKEYARFLEEEGVDLGEAEAR